MECFIAWAAFGFAFIQWRISRSEAAHYRDSYFRIIDQWCAAVRKHTDG